MITNTAENIARIHKEELELFIRKNNDYGNSYEQSLIEDGLLVAKIRLGDKYKRFATLINKPAQVGDESIIDTLKDLANYANMTIAFIEGGKK